jgi:DNA-binding NarL/FixJ family response regulator
MSGIPSNGFPPTGRARTRSPRPTAQEPSVFVAIGHTLLREGLSRILSEAGLRIAGQAADDADALRLIQRQGPTVVLVDAALPASGGVAFALEVRQRQPEARIVVISLAQDDRALFEAARAGVQGLLDASADGAQLAACVREVAAGEFFVPARLAGRLLQHHARAAASQPAPRSSAGFTPRELDLLELLASGRTNRQIAQQLVITENTVRTHLRSIMQKLDAQNRTQVAAYALAHGLAGEAVVGS